jgi:outer membrane protein
MRTLLLLAPAFILLSSAASVHAESLMDIYRQATEQDAEIRAAEANRNANREIKPQSVAQLLPNISASADTNTNWREIDGDDMPRSRYSDRGYSVTLTQPLFHYDYFMQLGQANALVAQADAEYLAALQSLMIRAADRYFLVLAAEDSLTFARSERDAISRQLEQAKERFEVGLIAITDVHEAQASYDLSVADVILAERVLSNTREALRVITNQYYENIARLQQEIPLINPDPEDVEAWVEKAQQNNPEIIAARFASEAARKEINVQRSGHLPTLDVVASHSRDSRGAIDGGSRRTEEDRIALELNVPLFAGGAVNSRTREAQYRFQESSEVLEGARRSVVQSTRDAYFGVLSNISRTKALAQAVVSTKSALEATEAGFEVGTRTIVDVLLSTREHYRAIRDHARVRYDYLLQTLRLKQAAGILEENDLQQIDNWLK